MVSEEAENHLDEAEKRLERARDLLDDEYFDESARTSYYSMYHGAKALLVLRDSRPKTHRGVVSELYLKYVKSGEFDDGIAGLLARDLQIRLRVDYDVMVDIGAETAKMAVIDAEKFLDEVKRVLK